MMMKHVHMLALAIVGASMVGCASADAAPDVERATTTHGAFTIDGERAVGGDYRATIHAVSGVAVELTSKGGAITIDRERLEVGGALTAVNESVLRAWTKATVTRVKGDTEYHSYCYFGDFDSGDVRAGGGNADKCFWATDCFNTGIQLMSSGCLF